jgi:hypothetical protein
MLTLFGEETFTHVIMSLNKWMTIFTCTYFIHVTFFVVVDYITNYVKFII